MQAARYYGRGDVRVENVTEQPIGADDVRIDIAACGICGSDLHEYTSGPIFIPDETPHPLTGDTLPLRIGHEFSGTVREIGDTVTSVEPGDTVVVNPLLCCESCRYCREGKYQICESLGFIGLAGNGGGFAENIVIPERNVIPLPASIDVTRAAVIEPLTISLHAVRTAGIQPGDDVAIFGCGPIGLGIVTFARLSGAKTIYVSEPQRARRQVAEEFGADVTIDPTETNPLSIIKPNTDGGVDVAFEVAGVETTVNQAIKSTALDGRITIASIFTEPIETHPNLLVLGERTITGSLGYVGGPLPTREFGMTIKAIEDGRIDVDSYITDQIPLNDIVEKGFETLTADENDHVKILVTP